MNPSEWTFEQGRRAQGPDFSIPIPDGYELIEEKDSPEIGRPFVALPKGDAWDEDDRILYSAVNAPNQEFFDAALPEAMWQISFDGHVGQNNPFAEKPIDTFLLEGDGVTCLVLIMGAFFGPGFEYYIHPMKTLSSLRVVLYNDDIANEAEHRAGIAKLVSGLRMNEPVEFRRACQLDGYTTGKADAEEVSQLFVGVTNILGKVSDGLFQNWQKLKTDGFEDLVFKVAEKKSEFFERAARYYTRFADVLEAQKALGASEEELARMGEDAVYFEQRLRLPFGCGDADLEKRMVSEGHLRTPEAIARARERIFAVAPSAREVLEGTQTTTPADPTPDPESEEDFSPSDGPLDYPTFILQILSGDWFWFKDGQIGWDGSHHQILGIEANAAKIDGFMDFVRNEFADDFDDINEVIQYFSVFLNELEKDEGLRVPRKMIARGLTRALPKGDLTGLTLANLAASAGAIRVQHKGTNLYTVLYDSRLAIGIPRFFDLCARMMWDLRQTTKSLQGKPFQLIFLGVRNIDADQCFGSVKTPVAGAQENPTAMTVRERPEVVLPN